MPFDFHSNPEVYLKQQTDNTTQSIMPFVQPHLPPPATPTQPWQQLQVLELGCGEGGNLMPFAQQGANCIGIDLNQVKIEQGKKIMATHLNHTTGSMQLLFDDIFNPEIATQFNGRFHLIILKDVIEHIPNKQKALLQMRSFLTDGGLLFIGWPPWYMPFGGHQQICHNKLLRTLPWIHLLPKSIYINLLKLAGEPKNITDELAELVDYKVTINQMNRLAQAANFNIISKKYFLINPIYQYKFGLKVREQAKIITKIPYLRDFCTTGCYYLLK
jgi:SAM-dependent methyltransferase